MRGSLFLLAHGVLADIAADAEIAAAREHYEMLKHKRETQTISASDAERMRAEKKMLLEQLETVSTARATAQKGLHDMELAFQKAQADVKTKIATYNEVCVED